MPDIGNAKTEKLISTMEWRINKVYKEAAKETKKQYLDYVEKFKVDNKQKLAELNSGKITQKQYDKWHDKMLFSGKKCQELASTMARDLTLANEKAMSIVNGYIPEAYAINRNFSAFQLSQAGVPMEGLFTLYDRRTVETLIKERKVLLPKPKVDIPKDQQWNKQHIRGAITQGVLRGESIPKIGARLENVVGMNRNSAIRNARTAVTGAQNRGRIDSYKDAQKLGINVMQEWLATSDNRTRESHLALSGERIEVGDTFSNGCEYPGDPGGPPEEVYNCRCTLIPYLPDYNFEVKDYTEESFDKWQEEVDDQESKIQKAIENAKEYSRDEHEQNNFSWDFWNSLTEEERTGIRRYTGSAYEDMNAYLRGVTSSISDYYKDLIRGCESTLSKSYVAEDTLLYRGMGSENTLARALGVTQKEALEMVKDESIIGNVFVEKGFCSTGINAESGWDKDVVLQIVAPKGTAGMYVDLVSSVKGEQELLLQKGTMFEIIDAKVEISSNYWGEEKRKTILKVVVVGTE